MRSPSRSSSPCLVGHRNNHVVQVLRAHVPRPPQPRLFHVQPQVDRGESRRQVRRYTGPVRCVGEIVRRQDAGQGHLPDLRRGVADGGAAQDARCVTLQLDERSDLQVVDEQVAAGEELHVIPDAAGIEGGVVAVPVDALQRSLHQHPLQIRGIHLDDEQVLARPDPARGVEREAVEESLVRAEVVAVQPRVGEVVDALEVQPDDVVGPVGRVVEAGAIPGDAVVPVPFGLPAGGNGDLAPSAVVVLQVEEGDLPLPALDAAVRLLEVARAVRVGGELPPPGERSGIVVHAHLKILLRR